MFTMSHFLGCIWRSSVGIADQWDGLDFHIHPWTRIIYCVQLSTFYLSRWLQNNFDNFLIKADQWKVEDWLNVNWHDLDWNRTQLNLRSIAGTLQKVIVGKMPGIWFSCCRCCCCCHCCCCCRCCLCRCHPPPHRQCVLMNENRLGLIASSASVAEQQQM